MNIPARDIAFYVNSFHQGEKAGYNYLFHQLYPLLRYLAYRLFNDRSISEQVIEHAFIQLWHERGNFLDYTSIQSRLCLFVYHEWFTRPTQKFILKEFDELAPPSEDTLATVMAELHSLFSLLPKKYRVIFERHHLQGKSLQVIAVELGVTVDTIRVRKIKGRCLLQERIRVK